MKVLISAYACEPDRGSEPGAGWNWVLAAARKHDVWVITRANNRIPIERAASDRRSGITFVYVDLPRRARFWKRGSRGIRLYYMLWQVVAAREARRLHRRERFDVVHHVTFANIWLPALTCLVDAPFVLGPVAGGQRVPLPLYPALGVRGVLTEVLLLALRMLSRMNPLVRLGWHRARLILVNNEETRSVLPRALRKKATLRPNACVEDMPADAAGERIEPHLAIYAGRLHRFKGVDLAIRAIALLPDWRLHVIGDGPQLKRLQRLAKDLRVEDRVGFVGAVPQRELWRRLAVCEALIFPSLKEGAGFVVAEAQALGTPVVALDASGPAALAKFFAGTTIELVRPRRERYVVADFARALTRVRRSRDRSMRAIAGLDGVSNDIEAAYRDVVAPEEALITQASA